MNDELSGIYFKKSPSQTYKATEEALYQGNRHYNKEQQTFHKVVRQRNRLYTLRLDNGRSPT